MGVFKENWINLLFKFLGPFGDRDEQLLFVQKVVPDTDQIFVRTAATGRR